MPRENYFWFQQGLDKAGMCGVRNALDPNEAVMIRHPNGWNDPFPFPLIITASVGSRAFLCCWINFMCVYRNGLGIGIIHSYFWDVFSISAIRFRVARGARWWVFLPSPFPLVCYLAITVFLPLVCDFLFWSAHWKLTCWKVWFGWGVRNSSFNKICEACRIVAYKIQQTDPSCLHESLAPTYSSLWERSNQLLILHFAKAKGPILFPSPSYKFLAHPNRFSYAYIFY